jgi:LysM repeat protein
MTHRLLPIVFTVAGLSLHATFARAQDLTNSVPSATSGDALPVTPVATTTPPASGTTKTRPATYTVASGDTLASISDKFHCTEHSLKKLNKLKSTHVKLGQVLKIPPAKKTSAVAAKAKTSSSHKVAKTSPSKEKSLAPVPGTLAAQPVQDFDMDVAPSTFASCPVPIAGGADDEAAPVAKKAPLAAPVSDAPQADETAADSREFSSPATSSTSEYAHSSPAAPTASPALPTPPALAPGAGPAVARKSGFFDNLFGSHPQEASMSGEWGNRFLASARELADRGIGYDESWRPEGESHAWAMDCSNTSRYLYKVTAGIQLPRTASDQYYYLHLQNKAWDVPFTSRGFADCDYLRSHLRPGDLLFWENTYRPERQPPITHVMIFLGSNERGQWIMAGSQTSRGGEHNRRDGGPDVYVFDPTKPCGGYTTWLGLVHHQGRFCAYGRPLDADPSKLAVAADN